MIILGSRLTRRAVRRRRSDEITATSSRKIRDSLNRQWQLDRPSSVETQDSNGPLTIDLEPCINIGILYFLKNDRDRMMRRRAH